MINLLSILLIVGSLYHVWYVYHSQQHEHELLRAVLAKDLTDFTVNTPKPKTASVPQEEKGADEVAIEDLSDTSFQALITRQMDQDAKSTH